MAAYLEGSQSLVSGVQAVDVVFTDSPFTAAPQVVAAWVQNTSADANIQFIIAPVIAVSASGFTVQLSAAPPTNNYTLVWFAGDTNIIFTVLSSGRKGSELPVCSNPAGGGYFIFISNAGQPTTTLLPWSTLAGKFANYVPTPPGSSTAAGVAGQWSVDSNFIYTHDGVLWGVTRRYTTWSDAPS
jgi:hypothetical protein